MTNKLIFLIFGVKKQQAFTLIELLVVTTCISILMLISVQLFFSAKIRAEIAKAKSDLITINNAVISYKTDHGTLPEVSETPLYIIQDVVQIDKMIMLTTPTSYLHSIPISPWYGKNLHAYNSWVASVYEEHLKRTNSKLEFTSKPIPDYFYQFNKNFFHTSSEWVVWSNGPIGVNTYNSYHLSNGLLSRGGIYCTESGITNKKLFFN